MRTHGGCRRRAPSEVSTRSLRTPVADDCRKDLEFLEPLPEPSPEEWSANAHGPLNRSFVASFSCQDISLAEAAIAAATAIQNARKVTPALIACEYSIAVSKPADRPILGGRLHQICPR
jgi:hypothetical protein